MNRFQTWLLTRLIRRIIILRQTDKLIDIYWKEAEHIFYEDNVFDRYYYFHERLVFRRNQELREIERRLP